MKNGFIFCGIVITISMVMYIGEQITAGELMIIGVLTTIYALLDTRLVKK